MELVNVSLCTRRKPVELPLLLRDVPAHQSASNARYKTGTALLFGGWWRSAFTGANLASRLLPPLLMPDILMALTWVAKVDHCSTITSCGLLDRFGMLESGSASVRYELEEQLSTPQLLALVEGSPHWRTIEAAFIQSAGCTRTVAQGSYRCTRLKEAGNSYMAPVFGNPQLHVLHEIRAQSRLLRMLLENESKRGSMYSAVVWSRLDFFWLRSHPQLSLLSSCPLWVPLAEDSGGLNDRHALMSREVATSYLSRYDSIFDGRLFDIQPGYRSASLQGQTSERYLAMLVRHHNISVCRFPVFAFLQCCGGKEKSTCNHKQCHMLTALSSPVKQFFLNGSQGVGGKYGGEMLSAVAAATASLVAGARLEFERDYTFMCEGAYTRMMRKGPTLFVTAPLAVQRVMCGEPCSVLIRSAKRRTVGTAAGIRGAGPPGALEL